MRGRIHRFLIAALCGSVAMLGACSSAPQQGTSAGSPTPTSSAGTAFPWGDISVPWVFSWGDDLSQWVTEDEMTELLVQLLHRDGTAVLSNDPHGKDPYEGGSDEWVWAFEDFRVIAHNGDHGGTGTGATLADGGAVPLTKTDEALPEGVVIEGPLWGFADGFYLVSGPLSKESLCMRAFYMLEDNSQESTPTLAVAAMMLTEMGWATVAD
jgi:hypothetical protein